MARRTWILPVFAAVTVVIALVAALRGGRRAVPAAADSTVTVARRTFASTVTAVGAVKPRIGAEVKVGSRLSGRVRRLRAAIGDQVKQGQVLAELETEELDAIIAQRRAEVQRDAATEKLAASEWERQQALLRDGSTTAAQADAAREQFTVAQAGHARALAALEHARVERSFTVIAAPISGTVASISTQEGETVAAGLSAPTFVTIVDLARLQVNAYVDEVDIGKVAVGQEVTFAVDAFPARDFAGRVAAIYPTATLQDNVVKYVVAVDITGGYAGQLRPDMTASVRIQLDSREVLAIPTRAIRREGGQSVVHVLDQRGAEKRTIRTGWRDGPWVEVVHGLQAGERVLLDPPATGGTGDR